MEYPKKYLCIFITGWYLKLLSDDETDYVEDPQFNAIDILDGSIGAEIEFKTKSVVMIVNEWNIIFIFISFLS